MEITLEPAQKKSQILHLLPCQIDHNGPAQVSTYFVQTDGADPMTGGPCKVSAFRGRQLFGLMNRLPSEFKGHVYSERRHSDDMEDETAVTHDCIEQFDEFTVWKHDNAPDTKSDPFFVAMEWNNIAANLHSTIPILN